MYLDVALLLAVERIPAHAFEDVSKERYGRGINNFKVLYRWFTNPAVR